MAGLSDLLGHNSVIEQLMLWNVLGQVISALDQPGLTALLQDVQAAHPEVALDPATAAQALARNHLGHGQAEAEAAKSGIDAQRFAVLAALAKVRLSPADLATAVLRSYMSRAAAEADALPQGITAADLDVLIGLAGDAPGPQQLAEALRRGLLPEHGTGPDAVTYQQGIAESRLHDKWGPLLLALTHLLLSPAEAASAVIRNFMPADAAAALAEQQGMDAATFAILTHLAGDAPGPQQLAEALRRGLIPADGTGPGSTSFQQGIAEGRLADKWSPVIQGLAQLWPTPTAALEAALKGQLTDQEGRDTYQLLGGDLRFYQWLLDSQGDAPSPLEAASMAARGIIPWDGRGPDVTSFAQAIREGRLRDKWTSATRENAKYLPPPGEIITFLAHRAITTERATDLLSKHYMDQDVLAAFLAEAEQTDLSAYRGLTQTSVVDMYFGHLIDRDQATELLGLLHVTDKAAQLLLSMADLRELIDSIQRSVQRIAQLYTGRKIGIDTARQALAGLGVAPDSVERILQTWQLQAAANVKTLSATQIVDAWYYQILSQDQAIADLAAIGYTEYDAWVLLSLKAKGPLPNPPPIEQAPPPASVIPGVT